MTSASLSVVIVDHRRADLRESAVAALRSASRPPDEVIIVDVDPVPAATAQAASPGLDGWPAVRVVTIADNPGYSAACNRGFKETRGDWVLFMNADVTVDTDCLRAVLAEAASDPAIAIATCRLVRADGRLDHACHRGIPTPFESLAYKLRLHRLVPRSKRLGHYTLSWLDVTDTHDIEACSGAFLLIRRDALVAVGGWDERYWFYAEDLDLCLRVARAGWRVRFVGSATATHLKGASSHLHRASRGLRPDERAIRRRVQQAVVESHHLFYREHQEASTARAIRPLIRAMFTAQRMRLRLGQRS